MRVEKQIQETQEREEKSRQEVSHYLHAVYQHYFMPILARRNPDRNRAAKRSRNGCPKNIIISLYELAVSNVFKEEGKLGNEKVLKVDIK